MNTCSLLKSLFVACTLCSTAFAQGFEYLEVTVLDPDGKPMPNAEVQINMDGTRFPMYSDDEGKVSFNIPAGGDSRLQIGVQMDDYLAQSAGWEKGESIPEDFTIPMKPGVPIGGLVRDEEGNPIEGVLIEGIMVFNGSTSLPGGGKLQPYLYGELAKTDPQGRWELKSAPEQPIQLQLKFSHPDYVSDRGYGYRGGSWEELRSLKKVVVLEKGIVLAGTIRDKQGDPVIGAKVGLGSDYINDDMRKLTDGEGKYRFNNSQSGANVLTVYADDYAPEMRNVVLEKDMAPVEFVLGEGHTIKFHVVDPDGQPISGVGIAADTWRDSRALMSLATRGRTDETGTWQWDHAPEDKIQFDLFCQGRMSVRGQWFEQRAEPHKVTMPWAVKVTGNVVDAESKLPLDKFQVVQGIRFEGNDRIYWERYNIVTGHQGMYEMAFDEPREAYLIRIEAEGYRPAVSRDISKDEQKAEIDFSLEAGSGPTGVVTLPSGEPADGAELLMATAGSNQIYISNGVNQRQGDTPVVTSDAAGKFELPFPDADFTLVALHDAGWAQVDGTPDATEINIQLEPWGVIEGKALRGTEPRRGERVQLYQNTAYNRNRPSVYWNYGTTTNDAGEFSFKRVRAGTFIAGISVEYGSTSNTGRMSTTSHTTQVEVKVGETTELQIGGQGVAVSGRLIVPAGTEEPIAWNMGTLNLQEVRNSPNAGNLFHALGEALAEASAALNGTNTGKGAVSTPNFNRHFCSAIGKDGSFEIVDVPPGNYQVNCMIYREPTGTNYNWEPQAQLTKSLRITVAEEALDLGEIELAMRKPRPVNNTSP